MPKRIFGSQNLALFERWVTFYSLRIFPAVWIGGLAVAFLGSTLAGDPARGERFFDVGTGVAVLALAVWMIATGVGVVWLVPRSFFIPDADRSLAVNALRFVSLLAGMLFLALGVALVRGIAPRVLGALSS